MKNIITIQHPQSEQHINRRIGSWVDWNLTEFGIRQAHRIGQQLSAELQGKTYRIYSSDLLRTRQTAEIIAGYLHSEPVYTDILREFNLGEAVGQSKEWARVHVCCPVWPRTIDRAEAVDDRPFDGAETIREVWERLTPFFRELMDGPEENVVLVSHDGTLGVFYAMWLGWEPEMLEKCALSGKSGGVSFLREDEAGHRMIERLNDMSYVGEIEPFIAEKCVPDCLQRRKKMRIETERLFLREMTEDDFDSLYKVLADSEIMRHYPYTFDEARVRGWIRRNIERYRVFGFGLWAVCLKDTGEMIGDCGLTMQLIRGQIKPEIGYHIRADRQRMGYAKEAAIAVRDWTFRNTPFNRIYSYMKYTNEASAKTAASYGCRQVDAYEDEENERTLVFEISRDEWMKLQEKR